MIHLDFLSNTNNKILNEFYYLTDGKITLGGSSVLKINNIIDRNVGNLNLVLFESDIEYFDKISEKYELLFVTNQLYGLKNKIYWFKKYGVNGVFYICNDMGYDEFHFSNNILRVATIENLKYNKEELVKNGDSNSIKHFRDIECINEFYGIERKRSLI